MNEEKKLSREMVVGNIGDNIAFQVPLPEDLENAENVDHFYVTLELEAARDLARKLISAIQKIESGKWKEDGRVPGNGQSIH
jgi:hypothetical protein